MRIFFLKITDTTRVLAITCVEQRAYEGKATPRLKYALKAPVPLSVVPFFVTALFASCISEFRIDDLYIVILYLECVGINSPMKHASIPEKGIAKVVDLRIF